MTQVTTQINASQFLVEGENTYIINLAKSRQLPSFFECKLLSDERGTQPGDETIEFQYVWDAEKNPLDDTYQNVLEKSTTVLNPMPSKILHETEVLTLDEKTKFEIISKLKLLESALIEKNIDDVLQIKKSNINQQPNSWGLN